MKACFLSYTLINYIECINIQNVLIFRFRMKSINYVQNFPHLYTQIFNMYNCVCCRQKQTMFTKK